MSEFVNFRLPEELSNQLSAKERAKLEAYCLKLLAKAGQGYAKPKFFEEVVRRFLKYKESGK